MFTSFSIQKTVLLFAIITSCIATYLSFKSGYILTYNDAASHLNIARRVVDSLTPGLAQIGTVWLPLPHLLMLLFAWNDYLWHTGLAGSIVSMASFVVCVLYTYKTIMLITKNQQAAVIGALIMALNPNLLYMQTTPMTEPLLLAMIVVALYFLTKYIKNTAVSDLILCSLFVALSTMVRYDGWFLFICLSIILPVWMGYLYGRKRAESTFFLFICLGGFGIFLWVLWNLAIFGDPLYFITGPYSAAAQQKVLKSVGQLPTQGNIYTASFYFLWSIIDNNGLFLFGAFVVGSLVVPFLLSNKKYLVVILAIMTPIIFNVIALYFGQSAMNIPQAPHDPGLFNIRYGMMAIPAIAVILGIAASQKYLRFVVIAILVSQSYLFIKEGMPVSLADGIHGLQNTYYTVEASKWLANHYDNGLILTSLASHDAFVARTGLPMKLYVHEGTREYWNQGLKNPSKNISYIAVLSFPPDSVYRSLSNNPDFLEHYQQIHTYEKFQIYKRK